MSAAQFFQSLAAQGLTPSTLFGCPGLTLDDITLDWLHIVDLGVAQDIIGNLFHECVLKGGIAGANKEERLKILWQKLREFYAAAKPASRLDNLTLEMFERAKQAPKLRAKGGETRYLVPFAEALSAELAQQHKGEHWTTVASLCSHLHACAKAIADQPFQAEKLQDHSKRMCVLWSALESEARALGSDTNWRVKPKAHLFQELCQYVCITHGSPEGFWTYKDESWCGIMAKSAKRRGGQKHASTVPERLLNRFRALHQESQT